MEQKELNEAIEALAREVLITSLNMKTEGKTGYALVRVSEKKLRELWETLADEQLGDRSATIIGSLAARGLMDVAADLARDLR